LASTADGYIYHRLGLIEFFRESEAEKLKGAEKKNIIIRMKNSNTERESLEKQKNTIKRISNYTQQKEQNWETQIEIPPK
jgi:hypothetical protein